MARAGGRYAVQSPAPRRPGSALEKTRDFKAKLDEPVFERLRLTAHKRGLNMSVVANKLLDANLPHFELRQIDRPTDKAGAAD